MQERIKPKKRNSNFYFKRGCTLLPFLNIRTYKLYDGVNEIETLNFDYTVEITKFCDVTPSSVGSISQGNRGTWPSFLIVEAAGFFETPARTFQSTHLRISDSHTVENPNLKLL